MSTAAVRHELMSKKLTGLRQIPTIPPVLMRLLDCLQQPSESIEVQTVTDLIAQDNSLALQCLRMANSPLFGRAHEVDSLRGAVMSLGVRQISDIAMTCGLLNVLPAARSSLDPVVLWEHSLGCALVCEHLARTVGFPDVNKAYLAGLLHDLGLIVNLWALPMEFRTAYEVARQDGLALHEAELRILGFTHCDSGRLLGEQWGLPPDLVDAAACHHHNEPETDYPELVALVHLSDVLCRLSSMNYGYLEAAQVDLTQEQGFALLSRQFPAMKRMDWARVSFELDSRMDDVERLVQAVYRRP